MTTNLTHAARTADLFESAIEKPLLEREKFVMDSAGDDQELAESVLSLLHAHESNDAACLLDRPLGTESSELDVADVAEREGDTIGRYKLLERIGEGGMGVVYMAQQNSDVRRRVALKIIKLGMDTKQVIARFENERQAMAIFEHPGITRLLDAGMTKTGRPYYVMELVKGRNIVEFASEHQLSVNQRLELMIDICHAFQHAHQRGVIHRDIKPSNILVGMVGGKPTPKIIDFGIAKALHHRLADNTVVTRYSSLIGTPQYMSPEQAESSGVDVDTRSDVYGLGVLLYELLTGTTPLDKTKLNKLNPLALIETLRNHDVETPSTRISKITAESVQPDLASEQLSGDLPLELDWIAMKSLAKDRSMRYQSASDMADDLHRFLNRDPIEAAPPSRSYRLKTHLRKHAKAYALASVCCGLILLSSIASLIFGVQAHLANRDKTKAIAELREERAKLKKANDLVEQQHLQARYRKVLELTSMEMQSKQFLESTLQKIKSSVGNRPRDDRGSGNTTNVSSDAVESATFLSNPGIVQVQIRGDTFELNNIVNSLDQKELIRDELEPLLKLSQEITETNADADQQSHAVSMLKELTNEMGLAVTPASGLPEINASLELPNGRRITVSIEELTSAQLAELTKDVKPRFDLEQTIIYLKLLADGFRHEFGDSDPEMIKILNLYSAALIQGGKQELAQATLLQAKNIARDATSKAVTEKLLTVCRESQR